MLRYHLRHAGRLLWRDKTLTASVVFTLALGFGANSAVFSVVEAVLLRPLPYPESDPGSQRFALWPDQGLHCAR